MRKWIMALGLILALCWGVSMTGCKTETKPPAKPAKKKPAPKTKPAPTQAATAVTTQPAK